MNSPWVDITAAIVMHNEDFDELNAAVKSFLSLPHSKRLYLIDNASKTSFNEFFDHPEIRYLRNDQNVGFARAHNQVLSEIVSRSEFHLILNPDIVFGPEVVSQLITQMKADRAVALSAPRVFSPDGKLQYTARRYPSLFELLFRRLGWFTRYTEKKEYRDQDLSKTFYPDFLHGCFLLFRTEDFVRIDGFDQRYFLYMEDVDICRKLDQIQKKKMYDPSVEITHVHKKASAKNKGAFFIHLNSVVKYFKKWGIV